MRLLVDAHCFDGRHAEGVNTYIKGIYTVLPAMAPDIDFYFASNRGDELAEIFGTAPNIHYIKLKSGSRITRTLKEFPRIIKKYNIDAAHFQYFAPAKANCRIIITLHDILFRDFPQYFPLAYRLPRNIVFRHSARKADLLTTVSEYSRQRISTHFGIPEEKIVITPNAVTDDFFTADREASRREIYSNGIRPFILNVNRIEPRKNQLALVKAFAELELDRRGYDLVMINGPALRVKEFKQYLLSLPEERRRHIHTIDGLPHKELCKWYAAAELFVYPSLAEGFGIPPLEAAAAGTPVICNNSTAMANFDFFGENLIDVTEGNALKRHIVKNIENPMTPEQLAEISARLKERYNWRSSAAKFLEALASIR